MRIDIVKNKIELGRASANFVSEAVAKKPRMVLGLPTGNTPLLMYKDLVHLHKNGLFDAPQVTTFNLDEYYGLSLRDRQSYAYFMKNMFFKYVEVLESHIPNGLIPKEKVEEYCGSYERLIAASGGLDITVLGIGGDGHIAFNEPGSSFSSRTRLVELSAQTIKDNSEPFIKAKKKMPTLAITMGIATIMESRTIMLLASRKSKADILKRALEGPVTEDVPASILQTHKNVIIIADEEAASKLAKKGR